MNNYHNVCKEYNKIYSKVFYLTAGHFSIEHDGVRGSNDHYSKMVDLVMLDFTNEMVDNSVLKIINASDLNQRIENIVWGITGL